MPRMLTWRMAQALKARKQLVPFARFDHPTGIVHVWGGVGDIAWDGADWTGLGVLGAVTPVQRSTDLAIQELTFSLCGIPTVTAAGEPVPQLHDWLAAEVRNREADLWLACVDGVSVVPDPIELLNCVLDYQGFKLDKGGTATIILHALAGLWTLESSLDEVWSSQDQKAQFPTDTGCDMIDLLQNQDVLWSPS